MSGDAFVRDRLFIEREILEPNGSILPDLSSSHNVRAASIVKSNIEPQLENNNTGTEGQKLMCPSSVFSTVHMHDKNCNQQVALENNLGPEATAKPANKIASFRVLRENDKIGIIPVPYTNESLRRDDSSVKANTLSTIQEKGATDYVPYEKDSLKRKHCTNSGNEHQQAQTSKKKAVKDNARKHGASGDPRMNLAVQTKLDNPELPLVTCLTRGGFVFNNLAVINVNSVKDIDGVTLYQRRNQLMRRLRSAKQKASRTNMPTIWSVVDPDDDSKHVK